MRTALRRSVITQRLLKAAMGARPAPYTNEELTSLAAHCTQQEDAATKIERQVEKSAAAIALGTGIGQEFDATVTGVTDRGTWVRLSRPPVEGKLDRGPAGLRVVDQLRLKLISTDEERGFIDFNAVDPQSRRPGA